MCSQFQAAEAAGTTRRFPRAAGGPVVRVFWRKLANCSSIFSLQSTRRPQPYRKIENFIIYQIVMFFSCASVPPFPPPDLRP